MFARLPRIPLVIKPATLEEPETAPTGAWVSVVGEDIAMDMPPPAIMQPSVKPAVPANTWAGFVVISVPLRHAGFVTPRPLLS